MGAAIYDLTDGGSPQATDYIPVIRSPYGPGDDRKIKISNFGPKYNLAAVTAPTVNNDSSSGQDYSIGSVWVDTTTMVHWDCYDATVGAAVWVPRNQPYLAGRYYPTLPCVQQNGTAEAAARIFLHPFLVRAKATLTGIACRAQACTGTVNLKQAIWANDSSLNVPTGSPLLVDNTGVQVTTSGGTFTAIAAVSGSLKPGIYWYGVKYDATTWTPVTIAQTDHTIPNLIGNPSSPASTAFQGYKIDNTYANNMPDLTGASLTSVITALCPLGRIKT